MIGARKATLHELQDVYGVQDLYDLIEVIQIDAHNARIYAKQPPQDR